MQRRFYDIAPSGQVAGSRDLQRINLAPASAGFSYARAVGFAAIAIAVWFFVIGSVAAPTTTTFAADTPADREAERRELEAQIAELEMQIGEYENQVDGYRKQGNTLKNEIGRLDAQIASLNLKLRATRLSLVELSGRIDDTESRIGILEGNIATNEKALAAFLRKMYKNEDANLVEVFLKNPTLSGFFNDINNLSLLQASVRISIGEIRGLRDDLDGERNELLLARADAETIKAYQETQRKETDSIKREKNNLLSATKGQESKYQTLLQETKKTAAEIRKQIFRLFGGGELSFDEAYGLALTAEKATGVRAALILAILDQESSMGRNVGRCAPEESMHPTRDLPRFKTIVAKLIANGDFMPEPLLVSCPIRAHGAYGGAMGPAQFIPSTWLLYESRISSVTGNNPPSPWRNADAFVATALYLDDGLRSSGCKNYARDNQHILPYQFLLERCAATKYYAGGNWMRSNLRFVYGDPVLKRADKFQADIDVLNS